jgi:Superfamily I DNA and RNA helicases
MNEETLSAAVFARRNILITGAPGVGKSHALQTVFRDALKQKTDMWVPALYLTPDRRRAVYVESGISAKELGQVAAPGGHRLVRSIASYAYLILARWRSQNIPDEAAVGLMKGAEEDAWIADFLKQHPKTFEGVIPDVAVNSDWFRTELRNLIARACGGGVAPSDLRSLGMASGVQVWGRVADLYEGLAGADPFAPDSPNINSARAEAIAARILRSWDNQNNEVPPVPRFLLLDDAQDCTPQAANLLQAAQELGAQIVVSSSPLSATASFRGGDEELGKKIAAKCSLETIELHSQMRRQGLAQDLGGAVSELLEPSLKTVQPRTAQPTLVEVVSSDGRQAQAIASTIRRNHLMQGKAWQSHAVIVRHSGGIEPLRRALTMHGVPVADSQRPTQLSQIPTCQAIFRCLLIEDNEEDIRDPLWLFTSPLIDTDQLRLFQFLRDASATFGVEAGNISYWMHQDIPEDFAKRHEGAVQSITHARLLVEAGISGASKGAREGLWQVWNAAGKAEEWRLQALKDGTQGNEADSRLDAVMAAFRAADLWEQSDALLTDVTAREFAREQLSQQIETDSLADTGIRPPGVEVLTVAQAAGREWDHVFLVDLQDGRWPGVPNQGFLLEESRLVMLIEQLESAGWKSGEDPEKYLDHSILVTSPQFSDQRRLWVRSEARLLVSAATRARRTQHVVGIVDNEQALSPFLVMLRSMGAATWPTDDKGGPLVRDPGAPFDIEATVSLLRRATMPGGGSEESASIAASALAYLARNGVEAANPDNWVGAQDLSTESEIEDGQLHLSPSRLQVAEDCALSWFFEGIQGGRRDGIFVPAASAAGLGTMIHEIAEKCPTGSREELQALFDERFELLGIDTNTWIGQKEKERAQELLDLLASYLAKPVADVQVEVPLRLDLGPAVVHGRIDRLETAANGEKRIVDIKTGKTSMSRAAVEGNLQLATYQLAAEEGGLGEEGRLSHLQGAVYLNLGAPPAAGPEMLQPPLDDESKERLTSRLSRITDSMRGPTFVPNPTRCAHCQFVGICPLNGGTGE